MTLEVEAQERTLSVFVPVSVCQCGWNVTKAQTQENVLHTEK